MSAPTRGRPVTAAVLAAVGLASLVGATVLERGSVEHANRLFRAEGYSDAAALYREALEAPETPDAIRYNLGTTLLYLGDPAEAEADLAGSLASGDSTVAFRSHYNLGYHQLLGAISHPELDSAEVLAREAVELNRQAMRLDPGSDPARWNLQLAQRALDSLEWLRSGVDEDQVRDSLQVPDEDMAMPALLRELQEQSGALGGQFFSQGEREALARDLAESPLSAEEADAFLVGMDQSPGNVLRRIFLVASENRWGNFGAPSRRAW